MDATLLSDDLLPRLEVEGTALRLTVEEYFVADDLSIVGYTGPQLVATVFAGHATSLSEGGREARPIAREWARRFHRLAADARAEDIRPGVDTAIGRTYTQLTLQLEHARGAAQSFVARASVNHAAPRALPPAWSALLFGLRDIFGPSCGGLADAWDLALTWCGPTELGPVWHRGDVVMLPHIETAFEADGPIFLRTGQPPRLGGPHREAPSVLYRLDGATLICVDEQVVIAPVDPRRARWRLPCGGATLTVHSEWGRTRRIVVRCDDARGVHVQRG